MENQSNEINTFKTNYSNAIRNFNRLLEEQEELQADFKIFHEYNIRKFTSQFNNEEEQAKAFKVVNDIIINQIMNAYWLFSEELEANKELAEQFLKLKKGMLRNFLGANLDKIYNDNWYMFKGNEITNLEVMNLFPDHFNLYRYILEISAIYGAYLAVITSDKYEVDNDEPTSTEDKFDLLLGNVKDIHFISPEIYLNYQYHDENTEYWNLFLVESSGFSSHWLGAVSVIKRSKESYLNIQLEDMISSIEKSEVCKTIIKKLPKNMAKGTLLQMAHLSRSPELYNAVKFLNY